MANEQPDRVHHEMEAARLRARQVIARCGLTLQERQWAERQGEELIILCSEKLAKGLGEGVSFKAISAVFDYVISVLKEMHR